MVSDPTCRALVCRDAGCLCGVGTYLLDTVLQGCRLFKRCWTYLPGTVLQAVLELSSGGSVGKEVQAV